MERRELPFAWPDVKVRLQRDIHRLLAELGIRERDAGGIVTPRNPTRQDRHPGSFVIWTRGDGVGAWKDYATGEAGDVFELIAYLAGLADKMSVYWWALDFLGLGRGEVRTKDQARQDRERFEREKRAREAKAEAEAEEKAAVLFKHWLGLPPIAGTVAEAYLREARRIPLERLRHPPGALRFAAAADHFDEETGEVTTWPAMVSAMTRGKKVVGLHRTFLAPDGSGKAPVAPAKKMFGSVKGAAIRLSAGPSGLSPGAAEKAKRTDPLAIGEGIETCLTVAVARPDYRVWAAGSLALMDGFAWPACASALVLLRDNDWKPEAQKRFARVEAYWREQAQGRPVVVVGSQRGNDFNDWVRA